MRKLALLIAVVAVILFVLTAGRLLVFRDLRQADAIVVLGARSAFFATFFPTARQEWPAPSNPNSLVCAGGGTGSGPKPPRQSGLASSGGNVWTAGAEAC